MSHLYNASLNKSPELLLKFLIVFIIPDKMRHCYFEFSDLNISFLFLYILAGICKGEDRVTQCNASECGYISVSNNTGCSDMTDFRVSSFVYRTLMTI